MTHVYFVRHAQPDYGNHDDASRELSPKGLADRALVADCLRDKGVDAVLSSPYRRAVDTVSPLAEELGLDIETVEDFRERKVDSVWIEDFHAFSQRQWADFGYKLSDGESLGEAQARNLRALDMVLERFEGRTVVVGSHGTALSTIIRHFRPEFGFAEFERIRSVMPWIVHFTFEGRRCAGMEECGVFTGVLDNEKGKNVQ